MNFRVIGIGELLWDLLPGGKQLGGAPANFVYHARALGSDARLISRVGNDSPGRAALEQLGKLGIGIDLIEVDPALPTGTVGVEIRGDGQPQYTIHENVAWDAIDGGSAGHRAVANADAVCFGTLAQRSARSRASIRSLVGAAAPGAWRILDVNLRQPFFSAQLIEESLRYANVLKLNDAEGPQLAALFDLPGNEQSRIARLAERHQLRVVACTRGSGGSLLYAEGQWSDHPGLSTDVVDTVGAGDSFTAAMTLGLLAGWELDRINEAANRVASFVCSRPGATPPLPADLRTLFSHASPS